MISKECFLILCFFRLAQSRTKKLNTGLVRKKTFKGNVTDFLAVNNTLNDLEHAKSTEDLFNAISPPPASVNSRPFEYKENTPQPTEPQPTEPPTASENSRPFEYNAKTPQPTEPQPTEPPTGNLIEF